MAARIPLKEALVFFRQIVLPLKIGTSTSPLFLVAGSFFSPFAPLSTRNSFEKIFNRVCTDLSAGATVDVVESMRCPWEQEVDVRNAQLL